MCGIAGITWHDPRLVERMARVQAHRGPDQDGVFADETVSLGHRRLSVLDLSERGRQPMTNADRSVWVVYNGEIYNFAELRRELRGLGYDFQSDADTEVIVHGWSAWGPSCVERFNGMFAFAVWDVRRRKLFLARDQIGVKPLYYAVLPGPESRIIFASELKGLLQCPEVDRSLDLAALHKYMGYEFVPSPETIFSQVRRLAPGHSLTWAPGEEPRVERYWRLRVRAVPRDRGEHERLLREALQRAVERQLVSDVPLGVFLSGGLDSSAIVAMMSRLSDVPIDTFSLYYEDGSYSELEYADFVAKYFGTQHHVIRIDPVTPETIEASCYHLDEPMTDLSAVPFYLLCKKVREHVTVCLSGEGGDELLCGYDRFRASKLNRIYETLPRVLREGAIAKAVDLLPDRPQKKGSINLLKRFIEGSLLPEEGRHMRWQYFLTPRVQESLFTREVQAQVTDRPFAPVRRILEGAEVDDEVAAEIYVDTCMTMPDSLLVKADKLSMAHALEVRVPFLDHEFAELCCTIPSDLKLEGFRTKSIFRSAMRGILPDEIRGRGKQGYSLPIKNWIRGELREFMEDTFASSTLIGECFDRAFVRILLQEHMERRANHSHVLWAILNLLVWHRLFAAPPAENPGRTLTGTSTG